MIESSKSESSRQILRYGMVGGGENSFIGDVHRKASKFDGKCEIVAGCFSRDYDNTLRTGASLGIDAGRLYKTYDDMAVAEQKREDCIDFAIIVTPNYAHYGAVKAFLTHGINVVCDKPLVCTVEEALDLKSIAEKNDLLLCVTYNYAGYPLVKQARKMIADGKIGDIIMVMGEYPQDWLITEIEKEGQKQAAWRTDPKYSGISNCIGDIGSHIENTVAYITGLKIKSLCAKLDIIGKDRTLDTNASVMIKYNNGGSGIYWASQVASGNDNGLRVRIFGTKGSIEWAQEFPNTMNVSFAGEPTQIFARGHGYLDAVASSRLPSGHTEGYYEAFANIYNSFATALLSKKAGKPISYKEADYQSVDEGLDGVKFIHKCVESSQKGAVWVDLD